MHIIRLRGPWQLEPLARFVVGPAGRYVVETDNFTPPARATMPADWAKSLGSDFLGRVRYARTFQKPTGLEAGERVWLVVEPPRSLGTVHLAERELGIVRFGAAAARFEITSLLENSNLLEIVVEHPALDDQISPPNDCVSRVTGGLVGEVRLEIETLSHREREV